MPKKMTKKQVKEALTELIEDHFWGSASEFALQRGYPPDKVCGVISGRFKVNEKVAAWVDAELISEGD